MSSMNTLTNVPMDMSTLPSTSDAGPASGSISRSISFTVEDFVQIGRDVIMLVDRSGSMATLSVGKKTGLPFGSTRWNEAKVMVSNITQLVDALDSDGMDIVFFGDSVQHFNHVKSERVDTIFTDVTPSGLTNLLEALNLAFSIFKERWGKNNSYSVIIPVITDGQPSNPSPDIVKAIVDFTKWMNVNGVNTRQVGFCFLQVGNDDSATKFLKFLDTGLGDAKFDIIKVFDSSSLNGPVSMMNAFWESVSEQERK